MTHPPHPAKFSDSIMDVFHKLVAEFQPHDILDPFAGTGRIHELAATPQTWTWGIELEPEWSSMHGRTLPGDATDLPFNNDLFDMVVTSPCYGNRMADHHNARDTSKRHTYRHYLGRPLSEGSAAGMQWGASYRDLHRQAWAEVHRVLEPGGVFVLNISNHYRNKVVEEVAQWHVGCILMDFSDMRLDRVINVETPRQKHGANGNARVPYEHVIVFRKDG